MRKGRIMGWRGVTVALCVAVLALGGAHLAHATGFVQASGHIAGADAADGAGVWADGCAGHTTKAPIEKNCAVCVLHHSCLAVAWPASATFAPDLLSPDGVAAATLLGRTILPLLHPPDARA